MKRTRVFKAWEIRSVLAEYPESKKVSLVYHLLEDFISDDIASIERVTDTEYTAICNNIYYTIILEGV